MWLIGTIFAPVLAVFTRAVKRSLIQKRPKGQTIICITHELSTIRDADVILFFDKDADSGVTSITGTGTYEELLKSCETFRRWHEFKWPHGHRAVHDSHEPEKRVINDDAIPKHPSLSTPASLQRSLTWSRSRSDPTDTEMPWSPRSAVQNRDRDKLKMKQMKWQLREDLRDGESGKDPASNLTGSSSLLLRSAAELRTARRHLDEMSNLRIARLLPQYDALVREMRLRVNSWKKFHKAPLSRLSNRGPTLADGNVALLSRTPSKSSIPYRQTVGRTGPRLARQPTV